MGQHGYSELFSRDYIFKNFGLFLCVLLYWSSELTKYESIHFNILNTVSNSFYLGWLIDVWGITLSFCAQRIKKLFKTFGFPVCAFVCEEAS